MNTLRAVAALAAFILVACAIAQLLETIDATPAEADALPAVRTKRFPPWIVHPDVLSTAVFENEMRALEAAAARAAEVQAAEAARIAAEQAAAEAARIEAERAAATPPRTAAVPPRPAPSPNAGMGPVGGDSGIWAHLARIRQCESGGNYSAVSSNGQYRGAYQFSYSTWAAMGGTGDPAAASPAEQDARAYALYQRVGSSAWPVCQYR